MLRVCTLTLCRNEGHSSPTVGKWESGEVCGFVDREAAKRIYYYYGLLGRTRWLVRTLHVYMIPSLLHVGSERARQARTRYYDC